MTKYLVIPAAAIFMLSCDSNTYEDLQDTVPVEGTINYIEHIEPIIAANCLHCHSEGGVSEFRPLGTYAQLKEAVLATDLLDRIQRQNGEAGQMPADGRMPMSDIQLILQWNEEGLMEN